MNMIVDLIVLGWNLLKQNHRETTTSYFLISSKRVLTFLYLILFWLSIKLLRLGILGKNASNRSIKRSVSRFCDRFRVITLLKYGSILSIPSSVSLFRISFRVLTFLPFIHSIIWIITWSPSSAFVKSTVSSWSLIIPSKIFSYFSGSLILGFFLAGAF